MTKIVNVTQSPRSLISRDSPKTKDLTQSLKILSSKRTFARGAVTGIKEVIERRDANTTRHTCAKQFKDCRQRTPHSGTSIKVVFTGEFTKSNVLVPSLKAIELKKTHGTETADVGKTEDDAKRAKATTDGEYII